MSSSTKQPTSSVLNNDPNPDTVRVQRGTAAVAMSIMWLTSTIVLAVIKSNNLTVINPRGQEVISTTAAAIFGISPFVWAAAFLTWTFVVGDISRSRQNNSLLAGTIVPSIALMYIMLAVPEPSIRTYTWYTFWPTHVGLVFGALV